MKIDKKDVLHIAKLSRLEFQEKDIKQFVSQFNEILDNFEVISKVDTKDVKPTVHAFEMQNVLREDKATECMDNELLMKNAPESEEGAYMVPKVFE